LTPYVPTDLGATFERSESTKAWPTDPPAGRIAGAAREHDLDIGTRVGRHDGGAKPKGEPTWSRHANGHSSMTGS
jgi:hypothetical protein